MRIDSALVKQLSEQTGIRYIECKSALISAEGDLAAATLLLDGVTKLKPSFDDKVRIDSVLVKQISDQTGFGLIACKEAMRQSANDPTAAIEILNQQNS